MSNNGNNGTEIEISFTSHFNFNFRVNNGLYSINALRQRPFSSIGSLQNTSSLMIDDAWDVPNNRCTLLNCLPPTPSIVKIESTSTKLGVACRGNMKLSPYSRITFCVVKGKTKI